MKWSSWWSLLVKSWDLMILSQLGHLLETNSTPKPASPITWKPCGTEKDEAEIRVMHLQTKEIPRYTNIYIWKWKLFSHVQLFVIPWTVPYQAPLSMEFSRPEYWSGYLFPSSGDFPNPGTKPRFPSLQVDSLPSELPVKPYICVCVCVCVCV